MPWYKYGVSLLVRRRKLASSLGIGAPLWPEIALIAIGQPALLMKTSALGLSVQPNEKYATKRSGVWVVS